MTIFWFPGFEAVTGVRGSRLIRRSISAVVGPSYVSEHACHVNLLSLLHLSVSMSLQVCSHYVAELLLFAPIVGVFVCASRRAYGCECSPSSYWLSRFSVFSFRRSSYCQWLSFLIVFYRLFPALLSSYRYHVFDVVFRLIFYLIVGVVARIRLGFDY